MAVVSISLKTFWKRLGVQKFGKSQTKSLYQEGPALLQRVTSWRFY